MNLYNDIHPTILEHLAIINTDTDNIITHISQGYLDILGYDHNDLIGKKPSTLTFNKNSIFNLSSIWIELNETNKWSGIFKNRKKNGDFVLLRADIYKLYNEDGVFIGYTAINTDITNLITDSHMFIYENIIIKTLLKNPNEIIAICLCENKYYTHIKPQFIDISDKLLDILGKDKDYIFSNKKSFTSILDPNSKYFENVEALITDYNLNNNITVDIINKNDKLLSFKISITEFQFQGNLTRLFKLVDISDEINTRKKLEELNIHKNNFLANFSHEIKTPLNATIGFIEMMRMNETDATNLEYFDVVLENSKHILDLMNDAIDFASIDSNKLELVERSFAPKDIQSTIEVFYAKSLSKEIDFTVYMSPLLPERMNQDILRIKQIISNLLSNALKFTDFGGKIVVEVYYDNDILTISIEDNGIGMTEAQVNKVFQPFIQASDETELFYGGTGLGLSIVDRIIKKMNGVLDISSSYGIGTKFTVKVPVHNVKENKLNKKLIIPEIKIFTPSFSKVKLDILKKYLTFFVDTKISFIGDIDNVSDSEDLLIIFYDDIVSQNIKLSELSKKNKVLLIRKINDIVNLENVLLTNIQEISLPLIGSKIYNALNTLVNNKLLMHEHNTDNNLTSEISGKILLVEDNDTNIRLFKDLLNKFNIEIIVVKDGLDALNIFKNSIESLDKKFDLIFMDENIPSMKGSQVASEIRKIESIASIERSIIISVSANRYTDTNVGSLIYMDDFISKPIDVKVLFSLLIKYLTTNETDTFSNVLENKNIKLTKLKHIRNLYMSRDNTYKNEIKNILGLFTENDRILLENITMTDFNNTIFNINYNRIIKNIRQDNK